MKVGLAYKQKTACQIMSILIDVVFFIVFLSTAVSDITALKSKETGSLYFEVVFSFFALIIVVISLICVFTEQNEYDSAKVTSTATAAFSIMLAVESFVAISKLKDHYGSSHSGSASLGWTAAIGVVSAVLLLVSLALEDRPYKIVSCIGYAAPFILLCISISGYITFSSGSAVISVLAAIGYGLGIAQSLTVDD